MKKTSRGQTITIQVCLICCFDLFSLKFTNVCKKDSERTWSTRNKSSQPSGGASSFGDSSGLLFSIYSKAADEEDNKMVERWQKDADGILIFVRPCACNHISFHIDRNTIDWSILCRSRRPPCCYRPGLKTEQPGHLRILPWQYLPGSRRPERNTVIHSFPYRQTTPIHSSEIRYLGEFALVLEPRYEP